MDPELGHIPLPKIHQGFTFTAKDQEHMTTDQETQYPVLHRSIILEELRWKKFPVLDDGFVTLVDIMGDDAAVVQAARVSYGADQRQCETCKGKGLTANRVYDCPDCNGTGYMTQGAKQMADRTLIRYLMRHRHTTPLEMVELKFLVRVPMDAWRQWIRHRTANVNEYSTRYSIAIDSAQATPPDQWRKQSQSNKQGSETGELVFPEGFVRLGTADEEFIGDLGPFAEGEKSPGQYLSMKEQMLQLHAREVYDERVEKFGIAKEQARKDLPLSTYTEAYWKTDLHNLLHFLGLRMDPHAQKEIRDYATIMGNEIVAPLLPIVWEAFIDYRLGAMFLSRLDVMVAQLISDGEVGTETAIKTFIENKREGEECLTKLKRLGFVK